MFEGSITGGALGLSAAIKAKKIGVAEAVGAYISEIEKKDGQYNAFLTVMKEKALARAAIVQAKIDAGEKLSPLAGVPIALNDNISTEGIETTCASKMLSGYTPVFNATIVEKLERAGLIVIGKLNMDEFSLGAFGERGIRGPALNPWDLSRIAGGSSGGGAAAVASGETPLAIGTDTGGGLRQPSAFCGATAIKPTYGAVSRFGIIACGSSLDQGGAVGMDIDDCAALLSIISGPDEKDGTGVIEKPFDFGAGGTEKGAGRESLDGLRVALPVNYLDRVDDEIRASVLAAAKEFGAAGAAVEEIEMPFIEYAVPAFCVIRAAEVSSNLARFDGLKFGYRSEKALSLSEVYRLSRAEGFGIDVKRNIMLGSLALSSGYYDAYYKKALGARALIKSAYDKLLADYDILLSPVSPATAPKQGECPEDPWKMYMEDIFTAPVNLAGLPAAALPCAFSRQGMPIGFQIVAGAFSEHKLIRAARAYQSRTDYCARRPGGRA